MNDISSDEMISVDVEANDGSEVQVVLTVDRSQIDGVPCVWIDGPFGDEKDSDNPDGSPRLRVFLNDEPIYGGRNEDGDE